jgi:hypothetical protein
MIDIIHKLEVIIDMLSLQKDIPPNMDCFYPHTVTTHLVVTKMVSDIIEELKAKSSE